jgi:hypothetical protein
MFYVHADSTNRDTVQYPHGNSYTLHLTTPVQQITGVELIAAKVPNSIYNLTNGSNILTIDSTVNISIPNGFYSACGLASALSIASNISVNFSQDEGKLIFSNVLPFTIEAQTDEILRMTGLAQGVQSSIVASTDPAYLPYGSRSIIRSVNVMDLSTNEFVFLDIDELRSVRMIDSKSLVSETYAGTTIRSTFGMIPMDVPSGGVKNFKEQTDYKLSIKFDTPISKISRLTIRWIDKDGQLINFQGFENNAFLLKFEVNEPKEPPPEPEPNLTELEVKRLVESMLPPPPPAPKRKIPRIFLYLVIIALLGMGIKVVFFKNNVTVQ